MQQDAIHPFNDSLSVQYADISCEIWAHNFVNPPPSPFEEHLLTRNRTPTSCWVVTMQITDVIVLEREDYHLESIRLITRNIDFRKSGTYLIYLHVIILKIIQIFLTVLHKRCIWCTDMIEQHYHRIVYQTPTNGAKLISKLWSNTCVLYSNTSCFTFALR